MTTISTYQQTKPETRHNSIIALLNELLAGTIELALDAKQAHWNVKGENFIALHELFDKAAKEIHEYADLIAERVAQMDGTALGTVAEISRHSRLSPYPTDIADSTQHLKEFSSAMMLLSESTRRSISIAEEHDDHVTVDILTEITRGLDKLHWFFVSHTTLKQQEAYQS